MGVSILIFVELALGGWYDSVGMMFMRLVSILVFVELALGGWECRPDRIS